MADGFGRTWGLTDRKSKEIESHAKLRGRRTRATSMARKPKVDMLARETEAEMEARQTGATTAEVRMMGKLEGRRSCGAKSVAEAEQRLWKDGGALRSP